jgi:hypothetical protein
MATLIRLVAVTASVLVVLGFFGFVSDEAGQGSKTQLERLGKELGEPAPSPTTERERERKHGEVREKIDDANDILLAPFSAVVDGQGIWVQRIVTTLLALLAYGLGLALLANFLPGRSTRSRDWRTAG